MDFNEPFWRLIKSQKRFRLYPLEHPVWDVELPLVTTSRLARWVNNKPFLEVLLENFRFLVAPGKTVASLSEMDKYMLTDLYVTGVRGRDLVTAEIILSKTYWPNHLTALRGSADIAAMLPFPISSLIIGSYLFQMAFKTNLSIGTDWLIYFPVIFLSYSIIILCLAYDFCQPPICNLFTSANPALTYHNSWDRLSLLGPKLYSWSINSSIIFASILGVAFLPPHYFVASLVCVALSTWCLRHWIIGLATKLDLKRQRYYRRVADSCFQLLIQNIAENHKEIGN